MDSSNRLSLDVIDVAEPCHASWEAMAGDDAVRYCEGCRKHVHDLSAMTRTEAEQLVCGAAGSLCVRFARAADGRVQTLEYRGPTRKGRGWKFWTAVSTCAASIIAGANTYFLGRPAPSPPVPGVTVGSGGMPVLMGVIAAPTVPTNRAPAPGSPDAISPPAQPEADAAPGPSETNVL